jgi:hypothetical protein
LNKVSLQRNSSSKSKATGQELFFSHNELKLFLYLAVLSLQPESILIYQNIDTIGHVAILTILLILTLFVIILALRIQGFRREETSFENPIYDYLILAAILLTCIFIGYLQFQYTTFGTHYGLATLIPTVIGLFCAYYFDNKSILSIAITGLAAYMVCLLVRKHYSTMIL